MSTGQGWSLAFPDLKTLMHARAEKELAAVEEGFSAEDLRSAVELGKAVEMPPARLDEAKGKFDEVQAKRRREKLAAASEERRLRKEAEQEAQREEEAAAAPAAAEEQEKLRRGMRKDPVPSRFVDKKYAKGLGKGSLAAADDAAMSAAVQGMSMSEQKLAAEKATVAALEQMSATLRERTLRRLMREGPLKPGSGGVLAEYAKQIGVVASPPPATTVAAMSPHSASGASNRGRLPGDPTHAPTAHEQVGGGAAAAAAARARGVARDPVKAAFSPSKAMPLWGQDGPSEQRRDLKARDTHEKLAERARSKLAERIAARAGGFAAPPRAAQSYYVDGEEGFSDEDDEQLKPSSRSTARSGSSKPRGSPFGQRPSSPASGGARPKGGGSARGSAADGSSETPRSSRRGGGWMGGAFGGSAHPSAAQREKQRRRQQRRRHKEPAAADDWFGGGAGMMTMGSGGETSAASSSVLDAPAFMLPLFSKLQAATAQQQDVTSGPAPEAVHRWRIGWDNRHLDNLAAIERRSLSPVISSPEVARPQPVYAAPANLGRQRSSVSELSSELRSTHGSVSPDNWAVVRNRLDDIRVLDA